MPYRVSKIVIGVPPSDSLIGPTSNTHLNRCQFQCVYLFIYGSRLFGVTPQDQRTPSDIFTDFHRQRSCLTACEFETFTLGGGGGGGGVGIYPNLLSPTHVIFIIIYFFVSNDEPWVSTLDVFPFPSPSHPFTKNGELNIRILPQPTRCDATCL